MSRSQASATSDDARTNSAPRRRSRERTREELRLAVLRIKSKGLKLSISAVAAEAGVSAGLIHNTYPDIAEQIRAQIGRAIRGQRDEAAAELAETRKRSRELRDALDAALADLAKIASINETLRAELAVLRASLTANVVAMPQRSKQ